MHTKLNQPRFSHIKFEISDATVQVRLWMQGVVMRLWLHQGITAMI